MEKGEALEAVEDILEALVQWRCPWPIAVHHVLEGAYATYVNASTELRLAALRGDPGVEP
jgi:hypothetical protein